MIKYIIVDDETASHDVIKDYAKSLSFLSHKKSCYNAFEAIEYLNKYSADLIFLDINMPKLSGLDFLRTLSNPPKVIVTSAYKEFALEGYELNVDDYLLKPFSFGRFVQAINKIQESPSSPAPLQTVQSSDDPKIFVKEDKKHHQIRLKDILFIEGFGNYVKLHLTKRIIISHQSLISISQMIPEDQFMRVHKSFIISIDKIDLVEGNRIHIGDHSIPIGKMYKLNVNKLIE